MVNRLSAIVGLLMLGLAPAQAALIDYELSYTAESIGSLSTVLIDSSAISPGDVFHIKFTLNDATGIAAKSTTPGDTFVGFSSPASGFQMIADAGNTGTFSPTYSSLQNALSAYNVDGKVQFRLTFRMVGGNSVGYSVGEDPTTTGTTPVRGVQFYFNTSLDYDNDAVIGDPLSDFLSPPDDWTVSSAAIIFIKTADMPVTPQVSGVAAVPEPGTVGLLILAGVGVLVFWGQSVRKRAA